jgi:hypothetical protein
MTIKVLLLAELKDFVADRAGKSQISILHKANVLGMLRLKRSEVINRLKIHRINCNITVFLTSHLTYVR